METRTLCLSLLLHIALLCGGQVPNNDIFTGGPSDGWASAGYQQQVNNIFTGGPGDGWASNSYQQLENNIFAGGPGDGWANDGPVWVLLMDFNGVTDPGFQAAITAFPNPTEAILNIDVSGTWGPIQVEVTNAAGQVVDTGGFIGQHGLAEIPGPSGMYLVKVIAEKGHQATLPVIKR